MSEYRGDNTTGFQSPAQDYIEGVVDLAAILDLLRRAGRYPVRVKGQALADRGIHVGDILVADAFDQPLAAITAARAPEATPPICTPDYAMALRTRERSLRSAPAALQFPGGDRDGAELPVENHEQREVRWR